MRAFGGSFKAGVAMAIQSEGEPPKPLPQGGFSYGRRPSMAGHVYRARGNRTELRTPDIRHLVFVPRTPPAFMTKISQLYDRATCVWSAFYSRRAAGMAG